MAGFADAIHAGDQLARGLGVLRTRGRGEAPGMLGEGGGHLFKAGRVGIDVLLHGRHRDLALGDLAVVGRGGDVGFRVARDLSGDRPGRGG